MPFPLILLGGAAAAAATGVYKIWSAHHRHASAKERYKSAYEHYQEVVTDLDRARIQTDSNLVDLGQTRLQAWSTMREAERFLRNARLKDRDILAQAEIRMERLDAWEASAIAASEVADGLARSASAGVATALGAYGIGGLWGTASTGTAIAGLGGAAAQSATLAWLGGGAVAAGGGGVALGMTVLGGLVAGPAIAVAGMVMDSKVGAAENAIQIEIDRLAQDEVAKSGLKARLKIVDARIAEVKGAAIQTSLELSRTLASSDSASESDAFRVLKLAVTLGALLEAAVLDEQGELT